VRDLQFVKLAGVFAVTVLCAGTAVAQTYRDSAGTIVPGVIPLPYAYIPLGPGQHNISPATATGLTVPAGARYATVCASTAPAKYTTDGTTAPTTTLGQPLAAGACVSLSGAAVLANFRAISATGTLDVEYFQ
jgi:hypothetical protein